MKRIKWFNVLKIIIFVGCVSLILHDAYLLVFKCGMFSYFGLATHILAWYTMSVIYDDLNEQIKSIPSYRPKHAKGYSINN